MEQIKLQIFWTVVNQSFLYSCIIIIGNHGNFVIVPFS